MFITELARLNGVAERIMVRGLCQPKDLAKEISLTKAFILMDVEGAEIYLLDPIQVAGLEFVHVIVEVHDFIQPGMSTILRERFDKTHTITEIPAKPRTFADFPFRLPLWMRLIPKIYFEVHLGERPAGMSWLYLKPLIGNKVELI